MEIEPERNEAELKQELELAQHKLLISMQVGRHYFLSSFIKKTFSLFKACTDFQNYIMRFVLYIQHAIKKCNLSSVIPKEDLKNPARKLELLYYVCAYSFTTPTDEESFHALRSFRHLPVSARNPMFDRLLHKCRLEFQDLPVSINERNRFMETKTFNKSVMSDLYHIFTNKDIVDFEEVYIQVQLISRRLIEKDFDKGVEIRPSDEDYDIDMDPSKNNISDIPKVLSNCLQSHARFHDKTIQWALYNVKIYNLNNIQIFLDRLVSLPTYLFVDMDKWDYFSDDDSVDDEGDENEGDFSDNEQN